MNNLERTAVEVDGMEVVLYSSPLLCLVCPVTIDATAAEVECRKKVAARH